MEKETSLSEKIITRVVRKDKEDPFMEHIVKVKDIREAVLRLKAKSATFKLKDSHNQELDKMFIISEFTFNEIFGEKLT